MGKVIDLKTRKLHPKSQQPPPTTTTITCPSKRLLELRLFLALYAKEYFKLLYNGDLELLSGNLQEHEIALGEWRQTPLFQRIIACWHAVWL